MMMMKTNNRTSLARETEREGENANLRISHSRKCAACVCACHDTHIIISTALCDQTNMRTLCGRSSAKNSNKTTIPIAVKFIPMLYCMQHSHSQFMRSSPQFPWFIPEFHTCPIERIANICIHKMSAGNWRMCQFTCARASQKIIKISYLMLNLHTIEMLLVRSIDCNPNELSHTHAVRLECKWAHTLELHANGFWFGVVQSADST